LCAGQPRHALKPLPIALQVCVPITGVAIALTHGHGCCTFGVHVSG
jgi:hypothetical protein